MLRCSDQQHALLAYQLLLHVLDDAKGQRPAVNNMSEQGAEMH